MWPFHSETSGKRWSTQVRRPLNRPASVTGGLLRTAMSGSLRVFADHHHRVVRARKVVRRHRHVAGGRGALEHARGKVEARVVARAVVAAGPFGAHVRGGADLLLERGRAAEVGAHALDHEYVGLDRTRD